MDDMELEIVWDERGENKVKKWRKTRQTGGRRRSGRRRSQLRDEGRVMK